MKKHSPVKIVHLILMILLLLFSAASAVMLIGGLGTAVAGVDRLYTLTFGVFSLVNVLALFFGTIHLISEYGKQAATFYKAFLASQIVGTLILIVLDLDFFRSAGWMIAAAVLLAVKIAVLCLLAFKKDLGKKNTWILFGVLLALDVLEIVLMLLNAAGTLMLYRVVSVLARLALDVTVALAIRGKYADKAARGAGQESAPVSGGKRIVLRVVKIALIVLLCLVLIVGGYFAYVFLAYHRIGDQALTPTKLDSEIALGGPRSYTVTSYNIGFGAYEPDYGFFMDGGDQSWAWSEERLDANLKKIASFLAERKSDFTLVQEVDIDATRTYYVDERDYLTSALKDNCSVFAQNFDSPFLCYPFLQPHGFARSGLMTFSTAAITKADRVELPIETGVMKLVDLDRCYTKSRITVADGSGDLVLYNFHLSAYTSDGTIATEQLKLLLDDMEAEYKKGSYCIAGGDFNKDILGDSSVYFGKSEIEYSWAQPIPEGTFDGRSISLVAPLDESKPVPTCRNADGPYKEGQYVLTIDGFLVSKNVTVESSAVIDTGFAYSDHNPVTMTFHFGADE